MQISDILYSTYKQFLLPLGGKRVPVPYRRNETGQYQKLGAAFQGKSSPRVLIKTTTSLAKKQNFDLNKASVEDIRDFMRKNRLGIDCSGFAYRLLNTFSEKVHGRSLTAFGLPHVGRTNTTKLTSSKIAIKIENLDMAVAGDLIKLNSTGDIPHVLVVLENRSGKIIYAHSSGTTNPDGVHLGGVHKGKLPEELNIFSYNPYLGDGVYRLKGLGVK